MARTQQPDDAGAPREARDPDETGRTGDFDVQDVVEQADQPVHESRDFPSGGGTGAGSTGQDVLPGGGSTGRNARDAGKTDADGTPGGGMAGSAGG